MYVEQLYTGCLAEAAYYIESNGEAAIIDPLRETEPYLEKAQERGAKIKYVLETHFHADFVSGHIDLARKTGATIVYGPGAQAKYDIHVAQDGEELPLGNVKLQVLHTPGHTLESSSYLLYDEQGQPYAVFTGDTLFVGDVGRPDLAVKSDLTKEDLARHLYDSLWNQLMVLPDDTIVYPGHGAGSACGKNIGSGSYTTIGAQKLENYALQAKNKEEFVKALTEDLPTPPKYFFMDAVINKEGYESIDEVMQDNKRPLTPEQVEAGLREGALVLDVRQPEEFEQAFIPRSVNIGLDGSFAVWVGSLLDGDTPLIVVAPEGREEEAILRLARVGYENVQGYLEGGVKAWQDAGYETDSVTTIQRDQFPQELQQAGTQILDVRRPDEYEDGHLPNAQNVPLKELPQQVNSLNPEQTYLVHCAGGYRSMVASSLLKRHGIDQVKNVGGGYEAVKDLAPA
jgi:glyoxylase-like metal-dependent hydrolase (beta-lactamase superfamily II)